MLRETAAGMRYTETARRSSMARMEWTVYYCGHGAMNYIEVMDESDSVVLKIVIDAGCTEDKCQTKDGEKREADVNFD